MANHRRGDGNAEDARDSRRSDGHGARSRRRPAYVNQLNDLPTRDLRDE
jgi:hypothetical protein